MHKTYILITKDIDINNDIFLNCNWVDTRWQWRHPVAVETPGGSGDTRWHMTHTQQ